MAVSGKFTTIKILHGFVDAEFSVDVLYKTLSGGAKSISNMNGDSSLFVNAVTGSVEAIPDDLTNQIILNTDDNFERVNALIMIDSDGTSNLYANCCEILDYYTVPLNRNFFVAFDDLSDIPTVYFFDSDDQQQQELFNRIQGG